MDLGLKGSKVLITGGSKGIGLGIAKSLAGEGANIVIGARTKENLISAATEIKKLGVQCYTVETDFSTDSGCKDFVEKGANQLNGLDILVNNVGVMRPGTLQSLTDETWKEVLDVNLLSFFRTAKYAEKFLENSLNGRILNISGFSGTQLFPGAITTSLPNAGIHALSKQLASIFAKSNVLVNSICPGTIETEGWEERSEKLGKLKGMSAKEVTESHIEMTLLKRLGTSEEIGDVAAFLVSKKNSYMTGTVVEVCGGVTKYI